MLCFRVDSADFEFLYPENGRSRADVNAKVKPNGESGVMGLC